MKKKEKTEGNPSLSSANAGVTVCRLRLTPARSLMAVVCSVCRSSKTKGRRVFSLRLRGFARRCGSVIPVAGRQGRPSSSYLQPAFRPVCLREHVFVHGTAARYLCRVRRVAASTQRRGCSMQQPGSVCSLGSPK